MAELLAAAPEAAAKAPSAVPYSEAHVGNGNGNGAGSPAGLARVLQPLKAFGWVAPAWAALYSGCGCGVPPVQGLS